MATLGIGAEHDSEEVATLKRKLAQKNNECGTLHSQILKKDAEADDLRRNLDEVTYKARLEADRAIQFDNRLKSISEDLKNEKIQRQNVDVALAAAHGKLKEHELEHRELQAALERLSSTASGSTLAHETSQGENAKLLARIRELEATLQHQTQTPAPSRRPRSSSLSNVRVLSLERQLAELNETAEQREAALRDSAQKLQRLQDLLNQSENAKLALEHRTEQQLREKDSLLEEQTEELEFLRAQARGEGMRAREEELLRRVEMEESNAEALRHLVKQQDAELKKSQKSEQTIRELERKLVAESRKITETEAQRTELVRAKESLLDELTEARSQAAQAQATVDKITNQKRALQSEVDNLLSKSQTNSASSSFMRSTSSEQPTHIDDVRRLLVAVERLRAERDEHRRSLDFVTMEMMCAQEELAKQKNTAEQSHAECDKLNASLSQLRDMYQNTSARGSKRIKQLSLLADTFAVVVSRSQNLLEHTSASLAGKAGEIEDSLVRLRASEAERDNLRMQVDKLEHELQEVNANADAVEELHHALADAEVQRDDAIRALEVTECQRVELNLQVYNLTSMCKESEEALNSVETQLADTSKMLGDAESQRGSLSLQVANLENDLELARQELAEAEQRYSTLQTQQLATMSTNQVTKALRDQIHELEDRVLRRTEQIGALQHDNKRLDTNLRLQEDRVAEMTAEIEMLNLEQNAMVDDCAAARDARDEAIHKLETLEMEIETWESKAAQAEEERASQVATMVGVLADNSRKSREAQNQLEQRLAHRSEELAAANQASAGLRTQNAHLADELAGLRTDRARIAEMLETSTSSLHFLQESVAANVNTHRELTLAIAVAQLQQRAQARKVLALSHARNSLIARLTEMEHQHQAQDAQLKTVRDELGASTSLHARSSAAVDALRARVKEQEERYSTLQQAHESEAAAHTQTFELLAAAKADIERHTAENQTLMDALQKQLVESQEENKTRVSELQGKLDELGGALEVAVKGKASLETQLADETSVWDRTHQELNQQVANLTAELEAKATHVVELDGLREQHVNKVRELEEKLAHQIEELSSAEHARQQLVVSHQEELESLCQAKDTLEGEVVSLSNQLEDLKKRDQERESTLATRISEVGDLQAQLGATKSQLETLQNELLSRDSTQASTQSLAQEVQTLDDRRKLAESAHAELQSQLAIAEKRLAESTSVIHSLQQDKSGLQHNIAELQANLHQLEQTRQTLETRADESAHMIQARETEVATIQLALEESRQQVREVEEKLQAIVTGQEQSLASLRAEFEASQSQPPKADQTPVEPQAGYEDLVERLRVVMRELEENDDRFIMLNKEKKSNQSKINALTRKVEKLQAKLDAAVVTAPQAEATPACNSQTPNVLPTPGPVVAHSQDIPESNIRPSQQRAKAPEISMETTTTIGKKRRVPDDFEDCDSVPPQAFTAESVPSRADGTTPRIRSQPHAGPRSGFTPVRTHVPSLATNRASPMRRPNPAGTISDVTNSPRGSKSVASKRGWLNKARTRNDPSTSARFGATGPQHPADSA